MIFLHKTQPEEFTSQATYKSENINYNLLEQIFEPLSKSINEGQFDLTAKLLNISTERASQLVGTSIHEIKNPNLSIPGTSFTIDLSTINSSAFEGLESSIQNYFLNNEYVLLIQNTNQSNQEKMLTDIEVQITRLNDIQNNLPSALDKQQEKAVISDLGLGTIFNQMANLYSIEQQIKEDLMLISEIKKVTSFVYIKKSSGLVKKVLLGLIIGIVLISLTIALKSVQTLIKD